MTESMGCTGIADYLIEEAEIHILQAELALQLLCQVLELLLLRQGCYLLRRHGAHALHRQRPSQVQMG